MEHHPTIFQIPNFLGAIGIPGAWVPEHVTMAWLVMAILDRKSTRLNSSHIQKSRMPSSA